MHDPLGDEMKALERASAGNAFPSNLPVYARIDGRGFSRFTKGMERPFDKRMTKAMCATATHLLESTQAKAAYVQSDEISLVWSLGPDGEHFFGGKPQKMASVLSGIATAAFFKAILSDQDGLAEWADRLPHFDARVVSMPSIEDATRMFAWRGQDARRNGLNQVAQSVFSHRELQGKSTREVRSMLEQEGVLPRDFPRASLNGTLLRRVVVERPLTEEERARIPEKHRPSPKETFMRHQTHAFDYAHPGYIGNLREVLFEGEAPSAPDREAA
jgi:tRNA(His) 5'-end guanylyltransferase